MLVFVTQDAQDTSTALSVPIAPPPALDREPLLPADRHPAAAYLASLAPSSRRTQGEALDAIARLLGAADRRALPWHRLGPQHVVYVREALAARLAPPTTNRHLCALRKTLRWAWRLALMDVEAYQRAADVQNVTGSTLARGRALDAGELRALFATIAVHPHPTIRARDAALLAVLYGAGLRRAEAVALNVTDYDGTSGALAIRHGKGRQQRMVYATNGSRAALDVWLGIRGDVPGALFLPVTRHGRLRAAERLTPHAVFAWLTRLHARAGVRPCSPHDLRRSFISDLLDAGADIATVQRLAGHKSPSTTSKYDRCGEVAKQRAVALLHVPYVGIA
jgi:site-specific recombinase XerD